MTPIKARKYMEIAYATAKLSKDQSTQVGALDAAIKKFNIDPLNGVIQYKNGRVAGSSSGAGYVRVKANNVDLYVHRLIWYYVYKELPKSIDHIDGCKTNNAISNLRSVTHAENHQNKSPQSNCWTGVPGVNFDFQRVKWIARIKLNNRTKFLGRFNSKQEAVEARLTAEKEFHPFRRAT